MPVPRGEPGERVLVALDLNPTPVGALRAALFRTEPFGLALRGVGGRMRRWRVPPVVAGAGLLVDLPVRDATDLAAILGSAERGYVRFLRLEGAGFGTLPTEALARFTAIRLRDPAP